jgi:hypothetical protein
MNLQDVTDWFEAHFQCETGPERAYYDEEGKQFYIGYQKIADGGATDVLENCVKEFTDLLVKSPHLKGSRLIWRVRPSVDIAEDGSPYFYMRLALPSCPAWLQEI